MSIIDDYTVPDVCSGCDCEIDPDMCWCGDPYDSYAHRGMDCHGFVPIGCTCHFVGASFP